MITDQLEASILTTEQLEASILTTDQSDSLILITDQPEAFILINDQSGSLILTIDQSQAPGDHHPAPVGAGGRGWDHRDDLRGGGRPLPRHHLVE